MKKNMNICPRLSYIAALLVATMFASCTKVEFEEPIPMHGSEICFGITNGFNDLKPVTKSNTESETRELIKNDPNVPGSLGLDLSVIDGIEFPIQNQQTTKGSQISSISTFDVAAYYYVKENTEAKLYFSDKVNDGKNTEEQYYWPTIGYMNFIATYPSGLIDGSIENHVDEYGHIQSFTYTINDDIQHQEDIMIATVNNVDNYEKCKANTPVSLGFEHLLAAVKFKVGEMQMIQINSLSIEGVLGGTITITHTEDGHWDYTATESKNYQIIYSNNGQLNIDTSGLASGRDITGNDNGLMMFVMPQSLGKDHKIKITYTDLITNKQTVDKEISFEGKLAHNWEAGKTTVYSISIANEVVGIKIPSPPDADAHYVRIDMPYDLTPFTKYQNYGITISNIQATASWLNDGNNNASTDKQSIFLKISSTNTNGEVTSTELTALQEQGYYTDEIWRWEYSINSDGKINYSVGSANGPIKDTKEQPLGAEKINLSIGTSGILHLFLDENDGNKDRNGALRITADIKQGDILRTGVVLSEGNFKQLCPIWHSRYPIGVERFDDETGYPFGFSYNRKIVYTNQDSEDYLESHWIVQGLTKLFMWLFGISSETVLPEIDDEIAPGFIDTTKVKDAFEEEILTTVTLDYAALNKLSTKTTNDNGLYNTTVIYNHTGEVDIEELEKSLDETFGIGNDDTWFKDEAVTGELPNDYAAFIALTRNRMRELIIKVNGEASPPKAILHKVGEGGSNNSGDETGEDIIEWYLPSRNEATYLVDEESTAKYNLNGTYWSSTAGDDPSDTSKGKAWAYTYVEDKWSGDEAIDRSNKIKVRAVRRKPTN